MTQKEIKTKAIVIENDDNKILDQCEYEEQKEKRKRKDNFIF